MCLLVLPFFVHIWNFTQFVAPPLPSPIIFCGAALAMYSSWRSDSPPCSLSSSSSELSTPRSIKHRCSSGPQALPLVLRSRRSRWASSPLRLPSSRRRASLQRPHLLRCLLREVLQPAARNSRQESKRKKNVCCPEENERPSSSWRKQEQLKGGTSFFLLPVLSRTSHHRRSRVSSFLFQTYHVLDEERFSSSRSSKVAACELTLSFPFKEC